MNLNARNFIIECVKLSSAHAGSPMHSDSGSLNDWIWSMTRTGVTGLFHNAVECCEASDAVIDKCSALQNIGRVDL